MSYLFLILITLFGIVITSVLLTYEKLLTKPFFWSCDPWPWSFARGFFLVFPIPEIFESLSKLFLARERVFYDVFSFKSSPWLPTVVLKFMSCSLPPLRASSCFKFWHLFKLVVAILLPRRKVLSLFLLWWPIGLFMLLRLIRDPLLNCKEEVVLPFLSLLRPKIFILILPWAKKGWSRSWLRRRKSSILSFLSLISASEVSVCPGCE